MNRREFSKRIVLATTGVVLTGCGGKLTNPTEVATPLPSRVFDHNLGGDVFKSFTVQSDAPMYAALQAAGITPGSSGLISSRDTRTGIPFQGNIIHYVITDGNLYQPVNGFDFKINDREIYDPMNRTALEINFYELRVHAGNQVAITLPPKWNGVSD